MTIESLLKNEFRTAYDPIAKRYVRLKRTFVNSIGEVCIVAVREVDKSHEVIYRPYELTQYFA